MDDSELFQKPKKFKVLQLDAESAVGSTEAPSGRKPIEDKEQNCILMKKSEDQFILPIIRHLGKLRDLVKAGKLRIEFEHLPNENQNDKNDDKQSPLILNFNSIVFQPNEFLFSVEKQSNVFELVSTNEQLKYDYVIGELWSTNSSIRTLNDCYLSCLNNTIAGVVCHSFAFCYDQDKSVARCQLGYLYFDNQLGSAPNPVDKQVVNIRSNDDFSAKYLEPAPDCKVYNLLFKNYFTPITDRMIVDQYALEDTSEDYTAEQCVKKCYSQTKYNSTIDDKTACRSVEYCIAEVKDNEGDLKKKSYCRMTNYEVRDLPKRKDKRKTNCKLFDCKYQV